MNPTVLLCLLCLAIVAYAAMRVVVSMLEVHQRGLAAENARLRDSTPAAEAEDPTKAPWASIRAFKTIGDESDTAVFFVSRHDIAECGLFCPRCKQLVAKRGDYSLVRRTLINGDENEVIKCTGRMLFEGGHEEDCPMWLAASPDTEHGDHLNDDGTVDSTGDKDPPEFRRFIRVDPATVIAEKYGVDVVPGEGREVVIDPKTRMPVAYGNKYDVLSGAELIKAIHAAAGLKEVLPTGAPPAVTDPDATPPIPAKILPNPSAFV